MEEERKLCPECKAGRDSYELDRQSPVCPFLCFHNGHYCSMFVKLENDDEKQK